MSALLWCPKDQWEYVTAPLTNGSDNRSAQRLEAVIAQFEIETNPRYQPVQVKQPDGSFKLATFCKTLIWDVTRALGCEVPHWFKGKETTANDLQSWWGGSGRVQGWREVFVDEALRAAAAGCPVLPYFHNPEGPGHIGIVVPSLPTDSGVQIAQAGATCFSKGLLERGFGRYPHRFFTHV